MRLAAAVLLFVAACEQAPLGPPAAPSPEAMAPVAASPAPDLPPPPRYVGRWAASPDLCTTGWWRFWNDEVRTGVGEMRCDILPPDATSGDERLRTVCQTEGQVTREDWQIGYRDDGRMSVTRGDAEPVTLLKC